MDPMGGARAPGAKERSAPRREIGLDDVVEHFTLGDHERDLLRNKTGVDAARVRGDVEVPWLEGPLSSRPLRPVRNNGTKSAAKRLRGPIVAIVRACRSSSCRTRKQQRMDASTALRRGRSWTGSSSWMTPTGS